MNIVGGIESKRRGTNLKWLKYASIFTRLNILATID